MLRTSCDNISLVRRRDSFSLTSRVVVPRGWFRKLVTYSPARLSATSLRSDNRLSSQSNLSAIRYDPTQLSEKLSGYIGKKHLQKAIDIVLEKPLIPDDPVVFAVLRVPFFLEPDYDESKPFIESNRNRLIQKWGGEEGWERQKKRHNLKGRGIEAGIPYFNLDRLAANSMASHRLIQYLGKAYGLDVSEAIYDVLNVHYFVEGHSLNDKEHVANVVAQALSKFWSDTTRRKTAPEKPPPTAEHLFDFLQSNEGRAEIERAVTYLHAMGIHSIPKFIVHGEMIIDGAAPYDQFVSVFRKLERSRRPSKGSIFGDILGVSSELISRGSHQKSPMESH